MLILPQGREQRSGSRRAPGLHQHAGEIELQAGVVGVLSESGHVHSLGFFAFTGPVQGLRQHPNGLTVVRLLLKVLSQYRDGTSELPHIT
jgi:hypothetical protein